MKNKTKIYVSGGGDEKQSFELDELFVKDLINRGGRVLYIPIALERDREGLEKALGWFKGMITLHTEKGIEIDMWINDRQIKNLDSYSGVYIGGGNTYKLLYILNESSLNKLLLNYLKNGGLLYGGSAGAIILGKSIATVKKEQTTKKHKYEEGLNLFHGISFRCHYEKPQTTAILQTLKKNKISKALVLQEETGLILSGNTVDIVGASARYFVNGVLQKIYSKNKTINL
jgi:dipeptidase E